MEHTYAPTVLWMIHVFVIYEMPLQSPKCVVGRINRREEAILAATAEPPTEAHCPSLDRGFWYRSIPEKDTRCSKGIDTWCTHLFARARSTKNDSYRRRANVAHIRQSRPNSGLGLLQARVLKTSRYVPSSIVSGARFNSRSLGGSVAADPLGHSRNVFVVQKMCGRTSQQKG